MDNKITSAALALAVATALTVTAAPAAQASGDDAVRRGRCSGSTHWKLKVGPEDRRLEVEAEVDSNRNGQTWRWRIYHDGSLSASGTRTTRPPSGSFEVRRTVVDRRGADTLTLRARNPRTGETCRGTVRR